jgi:6-phosphogluconolactonase
VTGSPFPAGTGPWGVSVDPTDKFAYASNFYSENASAYTINAQSGALTQVAGSPFSTGTAPIGVATCRRVLSTCKPPPL